METPVAISLDLAAAISAILWPLAAVIIVFALRKFLPQMLETFSQRVTKFGIGVFSLELAKAEGFTPDWSGEAKFDLRRQAAATDINDSTQRTFERQLQTDSPADYAIVNLGAGCEWLTSRLYIMAIIFARMNGLRAFVFVETTATTRKRFVGWAEPQAVRWALARRYAEYESAYADAYSNVTSGQAAVVVSPFGRLGEKQDLRSVNPGINLLQGFLTRIQSPPQPAPFPPLDPAEWQPVDLHGATLERAEWLDGELIEKILGAELYTRALTEPELKTKPPEEQRRLVMEHSGAFAALVDGDRRFIGLVDREAALTA